VVHIQLVWCWQPYRLVITYAPLLNTSRHCSQQSTFCQTCHNICTQLFQKQRQIKCSNIWPVNRPLHHTKRAILLISTWVIFTNGNVVFKFFSLLQLNEGKPVLFILETTHNQCFFFQFSGFKSLAIFLKEMAFFCPIYTWKTKITIFLHILLLPSGINSPKKKKNHCPEPLYEHYHKYWEFFHSYNFSEPK